MAGLFAGKTVLGDMLNKQHANTLRGDIDKQNTKRAMIVESYKNTYYFRMRLIDDDGSPITKPIRLVGETSSLAELGEPNELVGKEVIIFYKGNSVNRGVAYLMGAPGATIPSEVQEVEFANKLDVAGISFAPPIPA